MQKLYSRHGIYLFVNSVALFIALLHSPDLFHRPAAPFSVALHNGELIVTDINNADACPELRQGDRLVAWDSLRPSKLIDIEFLAELRAIGDSVRITVERENEIFSRQMLLVPYYPSPRNIIVIIFVGLITCIFGVIILLYGPDTIAKTVLYWTVTSLGLSVLLTTGALHRETFVSFIHESLFHIYYTITIGGFLFFSILFPRPRIQYIKRTLAIIFTPLAALTLALIWYRLRAIFLMSLRDLHIFSILFDIFHLCIYICIGGGIVSFLYAIRTSDKTDEKSQSRWILWGVTIGSFPFLFLSILPQFFGISELVAEEFTVFFFLVIPFSFTMAIVRYRLLNIDILINRTLVYGILTVFIGSAYLLVLFLIISAIGGSMIFEEYFTILLITLLVTVFFNPIRIRIQKLVDDYLFTARAQYRKAVRIINRDLGSVYNTTDLFQQLVQGLATYIPADIIAFYRYANERLELAATSSGKPAKNVPVSRKEIAAFSQGMKIYALPGLVTISETGDITPLKAFFARLKFSLAIPVLANNANLYGILACNPHHKKDHFIEEEVDLMLTAAGQTNQNLKRLLLQEQFIRESEEKKRLKAINDLMSFYVSSVSHELKSPLSAIQLHTDILCSAERKRNEHLEIIKGEGERLQRLIENVLDISKIERGVRSYRFSRQNVNAVINRVLTVMEYQIDMYKIHLKKKLSEELPDINADGEALEQALINLIDNAIKYSFDDERFIEIKSERIDGSVCISVRDKGVGIDRKELKKIFSRFYRGSDSRVHNIGGAGIGLTIVQHIVEAHHGKVKIESEPGKGSTFRIILPVPG